MRASSYNNIVYMDRDGKTLYERPLLKSDKLANEFLAMQSAAFIDENEEVKISLTSKVKLIDDTDEFGDRDNLLLGEIAEIFCMQLSNSNDTINADYYTLIDGMKVIALNVKSGVVKIRLEEKDEEFTVTVLDNIDLSNIAGVGKYDLPFNTLVYIIEAAQKTQNLSPVIHEFSSIPHNDILNKIITQGALDNAQHMVVINDTFNNQAGISLNDNLVDYNTRITSSYSTYEGKLLINGKKIYE